jgi:N-formylglutamate amidohydrolase
MAALAGSDYSVVLDGRFRGGYITRHYGSPGSNIHALQLEISQRSYMQETPPEYDLLRAHQLQFVLKELVRVLISWSPVND